MGCYQGTRAVEEEDVEITTSQSEITTQDAEKIEAEEDEIFVRAGDNVVKNQEIVYEKSPQLKLEKPNGSDPLTSDSTSVHYIGRDEGPPKSVEKKKKIKVDKTESQSVIVIDQDLKKMTSIYGPTSSNCVNTEPYVSWDERMSSNSSNCRTMPRNVRSVSDAKILTTISSKRPMEALDLIKPNEVAGYNQLYDQSEDESDYYAVLDERTEDDFKEAFQHVDGDNDSRITFKELCYALEYLEIRWDILEAQKVFAELDAETRLRTLDYTSFCHACHILEPRLRDIWKNIQRKTLLVQEPRSRSKMDEGVSCRKAESASFELKEVDEEGKTTEQVLFDRINDTKAYNWPDRVAAIKKITALGRDMAPDGFEKYFEPLCPGFCLQIMDNKSVVVKETCLALAGMYTEMQDKSKLLPFVDALLTALLHSLCIRTKIISESAFQCCEHLIKCVADDPKTLPLLNTLTSSAKTHNHPRAREACFTFLTTYIDLPKSLCKSEEPDSILWVTIIECVQAGVSDVDEVRTAALNTLLLIEDVAVKVQEEIVSRFDDNMMERFNSVRATGDVFIAKKNTRRVSPIQRRKHSLRKTKARILKRVDEAKARVDKICKTYDSNSDGWLTSDEVEKVLRGLGYKTDINYRVGFLMEHLKRDEQPEETNISDLVIYFGGLVEDDPDAIPNKDEKLGVPSASPRARHARKLSRGNRRKLQNIPKNLVFQGERVKTILQSRDKDNTGYFPVEELSGIWLEIGEANKDIEKCKRELAVDSRISIKEFHEWWLFDEMTKHTVESKFQNLLKQISEDDLRKAFKRCDSDNDGVMRIADFCMAMESLGLQWSLDEAKSAFKLIDVNHDKSIDYEAFKHGVYHINADNLEVFWTRLLTGEVEEEKKEVEEEYTRELILDLLKDVKGDWRKRVKAMENLVILLKELTDPEFQEEFNVWSERLTLQVKDRRSQVSRAATENVGKIIAHRKHAFHPFVRFWYPQLMAVVRMTGVKVQSQSAHQLCKVLVINVSDTPEEHHTLDAIIEQYENGVHKLLKKACFEYLTIILEQISKNDNNVPRTDEYVTKIQNMLSKGIEDAHAPTRNQAFRGLAFLSFIDEARANQVMQVMSTRPAVMKKYTRIRRTIEEKESSLVK